MEHVPQTAQEAVFHRSVPVASDAIPVRGLDLNAGCDLDTFAESMLTTGFQATSVGMAIQQINQMISWRLSDVPVADDEEEAFKSMSVRQNTKCTIYLSYTSNMASSGVREIIRFLVQHKLVDVLVTTAGGIEEDIIKCLADTYLGDFALDGRELRKKGINRIGNLIIPNDNYIMFEEFMKPLLQTMTDEQVQEGFRWTPSKMIHRLGKEINNESSIYYWAWKNNIPVFCPGITDGSIGDMVYFHSHLRPEFILDIAQDVRLMNDTAIQAKCTGMIILGGGTAKHHTCNANMMRNGANYAVYINTGQEFDGSDSGARPDEAISWGKIRVDAHPVKIYTDATLVFPLIVTQTFYKEYLRRKTQPIAA